MPRWIRARWRAGKSGSWRGPTFRNAATSCGSLSTPSWDTNRQGAVPPSSSRRVRTTGRSALACSARSRVAQRDTHSRLHFRRISPSRGSFSPTRSRAWIGVRAARSSPPASLTTRAPKSSGSLRRSSRTRAAPVIPRSAATRPPSAVCGRELANDRGRATSAVVETALISYFSSQRSFAALRMTGGRLAKTKEPRSRGAPGRKEECRPGYALKDLPQPQPPVDCGFVTENPAPRKSST